jgi:pyrroline-5-carboxylate reductase
VKAIVFLGGGRITRALLAGYDPPIVVHDRHSEKLQKLKREYRIAVEPDLHRAVESAHVLIIAVQPDGRARAAERSRNAQHSSTLHSGESGSRRSTLQTAGRAGIGAMGPGHAQPRLPHRVEG